MSATVHFDLADGTEITLKKGETVKAVGTHGYAYVVHWDEDNDLLVDGDSASELHRVFSDSDAEDLYRDICADLRSRQILPTNARVMRILNKELAEEDRTKAINELVQEVRNLKEETSQLRSELPRK